MRLITFSPNGCIDLAEGVHNGRPPRHVRLASHVIRRITEDVLARSGVTYDVFRSNDSREIAAQLRAQIRGDRTWQTAAKILVEFSFGRTIEFTKQELDAINLPEWDEFVVGSSMPLWRLNGSASPEPPALFSVSPTVLLPNAPTWQRVHSYAVQLQRSLPGFSVGVRACVVGGIVMTSDRYIPIGLRAGEYETGKLSVVPAGSASWPSFNLSLLGELQGEIGLTERDIVTAPRVIGVFENLDGRLIFVYLIELRLSADDVGKRIPSAPDRYEHERIFFIPGEDWVDVAMARTMCSEWAGRSCEFLPAGAAALALAQARIFQEKAYLHGVFENGRDIFATD